MLVTDTRVRCASRTPREPEVSSWATVVLRGRQTGRNICVLFSSGLVTVPHECAHTKGRTRAHTLLACEGRAQKCVGYESCRWGAGDTCGRVTQASRAWLKYPLFSILIRSSSEDNRHVPPRHSPSGANFVLASQPAARRPLSAAAPTRCARGEPTSLAPATVRGGEQDRRGGACRYLVPVSSLCRPAAPSRMRTEEVGSRALARPGNGRGRKPCLCSKAGRLRTSLALRRLERRGRMRWRWRLPSPAIATS